MAIGKETAEFKALEPTPTDSLPLKQSRRAQEQNQESNQYSDEDSLRIVHPASVAPPSEPVQDNARGAESPERDALDDSINETKAISHLVSTGYCKVKKDC